jgi:hypothetical protein
VSFSIDANVLLYASDMESAYGGPARAFLVERAAGPDIFYLAWPTIMSYLRIATHPGVFRAPLSPGEAIGNIQQLLDLPHVRTLAEDEGFWEIYRGVAGTFPLRGNAVPDAHVAALLRQHGVGLIYTNDADFKRFPFLSVVNPFEP